MNSTHFSELSSALTIVAIERDLCQTNPASLDHFSGCVSSTYFISVHEMVSSGWMCPGCPVRWRRHTGFSWFLSAWYSAVSLFVQEWKWWSTFLFVWMVPFFLVVIFLQCHGNLFRIWVFPFVPSVLPLQVFMSCCFSSLLASTPLLCSILLCTQCGR